MPDAATSPERFSLAVITDDTEPYPEIRRELGNEFRTFLATTEDEIKTVLEHSGLHAILFNLDCIGDGPVDALDVLEEIRKLREDLVLVAFTKTNNRAIPFKASRAGADEFFLFPLNYHELKIVLLRAIEKRALELEGRRVIQQVERGSAFYGLIGSSPAMQKGVPGH